MFNHKDEQGLPENLGPQNVPVSNQATYEGIQALFDLLQNPNCRLTYLALSDPSTGLHTEVSETPKL